MYSDDQPARLEKLALSVGFLALAIGVGLAYRSPARGYELSIYEATPAGFWVGVALAAVVGVGVAVSSLGRVRDAAHVLVAGAVLSVVGLPAIRGYHYYGAGDSLTHLGWAREIQSGAISPLDNLYPGIHLVGLQFEALAGIELTRAILVLPVVVFPLVFVTFAALCVAYLTRSRWAVTVGLLSGLLLLPINGVSLHTVPHPSSQAILFVPVVLYMLFRHLEAPSGDYTVLSASSLALALAAVALVVYHPQEAMNFLALLGAIVVLQFVYRRYRDDHAIANHRPVHAHTALVGGVFLAWTFRHERARNRLEWVVESIVFGGQETLDQTGQRAASLQAVGGSVEEVFLKLFGVTMLFGALAALVALSKASGGIGENDPSRSALTTYLIAGLIPLAALFGIIFVADQGDHYFRFLGFMLVPITLLGAVALAQLADGIDRHLDRRILAVGLCLLFLVALPAQALTFHASPYVYQNNQQVTEGTMEGHANAFEYRDDETVMMGVRSGPQRYVDAHYGTENATGDLNFPGYREEVPGEVFDANLTSHYDGDRYLTATSGDRQREVELFDELRYSESGFERLERDRSVNRVQTNGDFELYRVEGE